MKLIFGSVVGRKFQKVSHKIAKVRCTKKEEHIILENTEELYNMFSIFEDRRHPITEEEKQNIEEGKKLYKKLMGDK